MSTLSSLNSVCLVSGRIIDVGKICVDIYINEESEVNGILLL